MRGEDDCGEQMRRVLAAAGQKAPGCAPGARAQRHASAGEVPGRAVSGQFGELAQLLYDQAALAEGTQLRQPAEFVPRLNRLLVRLAAAPGAAGA